MPEQFIREIKISMNFYCIQPPLYCHLFQVMRNNVIVDSIAISRVADTQLDDLAKATDGKAHFYPDTSSTSNVLNEALLTIGQRDTSE